MTKEEAIEILSAYGVPQDEEKFSEALKMAIKALCQYEEPEDPRVTLARFIFGDDAVV